MSEIKINKTKEDNRHRTFSVQILEGDSSTEHQVSLSNHDYRRLSQRKTPEEFIKKTFEFLLERESKESILGKFDVMDIGKYFPEYEKEITS